jgi:hypothetical protein
MATRVSSTAGFFGIFPPNICAVSFYRLDRGRGGRFLAARALNTGAHGAGRRGEGQFVSFANSGLRRTLGWY